MPAIDVKKPLEATARRPSALTQTNDESDEATLSLQRRQVSALKAHQQTLSDLRRRERDLEVECIAAEVALRSRQVSPGLALAPQQAQSIVAALDHIRALQGQLDAGVPHLVDRHKGLENRLEQLQTGLQALNAWLEAPCIGAWEQTRSTVRAVLLAASLGILGAALTIHAALLLLLLPIGPILLLLRPGQDIEWRRLGAKRRFQETSLGDPMEWKEHAVRQRIAELEAALVSASSPSGEAKQAPSRAEGESPSLEVRLATANQHLAQLVAEGGLEASGVDWDVEQQLRLMADVERVQCALREVRETRKAATKELNAVREHLFGFLARQGAAPPHGHADTAALAEALERLIARRQHGRPA